MSNPANLSFSTGFNQPKILVNDHEDVTVPSLAISTLLTITTSSLTVPLPPRVFIEYNGKLAPAYAEGVNTRDVLGVDVGFLASFNSLNALIIESNSNEPSTVDLRIHYRVYRDAKST
jgi:hypothetical protein